MKPNRELLRPLEEILTTILEQATPAQWGNWLRAPLEHAAARGDLELMDKLLDAGANGEAGWKGCDDRTLLNAAAEGGNDGIGSTLLAAGSQPDENVRSGCKKQTYLHRAVVRGHVDVVKTLVRTGARVGIPDSEKRGPLHLAIKGGHNLLVSYLLTTGICPNEKDTGGNSPLHIATALGNDQIVSELVHKADKDAVNAQALSPLHLAAIHNHIGVAKVLLVAGANADLCHRPGGKTALHLCAELGHLEMIQLLIEHGADVNRAITNGFTALHLATAQNNPRAIDCLVSLGANTQEPLDELGFTSLHFGVICMAYEAVCALLENGANPRAQGSDDQTPLHLATRVVGKNTWKIVDLLLRYGADETALDASGCTARDGLNREHLGSNAMPDAETRGVQALLDRAPADRAWRRRGFLVLCRAVRRWGLRGDREATRRRKPAKRGRVDGDAPSPLEPEGNVNVSERLSTMSRVKTNLIADDGIQIVVSSDASDVMDAFERVLGLEQETLFRYIVEFI